MVHGAPPGLSPMPQLIRAQTPFLFRLYLLGLRAALPDPITRARHTGSRAQERPWKSNGSRPSARGGQVPPLEHLTQRLMRSLEAGEASRQPTKKRASVGRRGMRQPRTQSHYINTYLRKPRGRVSADLARARHAARVCCGGSAVDALQCACEEICIASGLEESRMQPIH